MSVLGKPLNKLPVIFDKDCGYIPSLLNNAAWYIEKNIKTPELFQAQGDSTRVNQLLHQMSSHKFVKMRHTNVHDVIEMMKTFLVQLPEPLLSDEVCDALILASETDNNNYSSILTTLKQSQPAHFAILHFLMRLLGKVAEFTKYNNMDVRKLATIFVLDILKPLTLDDSTNQVPLSFPKDRMQRLPYLIMVIENLVQNIGVFQRPRSPLVSFKENRGRGTERTSPKSPPPSVPLNNKSSSAPGAMHPHKVHGVKSKGHSPPSGHGSVNWREMYGRFSAETLPIVDGTSTANSDSKKKYQLNKPGRDRNDRPCASRCTRNPSPEKQAPPQNIEKRQPRGQGQTAKKSSNKKQEKSTKSKGNNMTRKSASNDGKSVLSVRSKLKVNSANNVAATESKARKPPTKTDTKTTAEENSQRVKLPIKSALKKKTSSVLRSRSLSDEIKKPNPNDSLRNKRPSSVSSSSKFKPKGQRQKSNKTNCTLDSSRASSVPWEEITPWTHASGNHDIAPDSEGISLLMETIRHPRILLCGSGGGDRSLSTMCPTQTTIPFREQTSQVSRGSNPTRSPTPFFSSATSSGSEVTLPPSRSQGAHGGDSSRKSVLARSSVPEEPRAASRQRIVSKTGDSFARTDISAGKGEFKSGLSDSDSKKLSSYASSRECKTCLEEPLALYRQDQQLRNKNLRGRCTPSPPRSRRTSSPLSQQRLIISEAQLPKRGFNQQQQAALYQQQPLTKQHQQERHKQKTQQWLQRQENIFWVRQTGPRGQPLGPFEDVLNRTFNVKEGIECPMLLHRQRLQMFSKFHAQPSSKGDSILIQWIVDVSLVLTALFSVCVVLCVHQGHIGML